ncbi:MAG TPA: hypothetical protein PKC21_05540 [Oligoflexia bacterium]|nr:hypothetical protein [Oligoflexia bacterium]HMR24799.1 hypothetical protein [Oligoflexia bacterium]
MLKNKLRIIHIKNIFSFKAYLRTIIFIAFAFFVLLTYLQVYQSIQRYRYQDLINYCQNQYFSKKLTPSDQQIAQAQEIVQHVRYEYMAEASQIFERAVAYRSDSISFIEPLIRTYIFRTPLENNHSFDKNLETLANGFIAKHKKNNYGHAILSSLALKKNKLPQASNHLSNISSNHALSAILDFKINFYYQNSTQQTLKDKLAQLKKHPQLIHFYELMQYEYYIKTGNYFAAKPILNKRLLQFPKDYWAQIQVSQILEKGQNLEIFKNELASNNLNSQYASVQLSYAKLLCTFQQLSKCMTIYQQLANKNYQINTPMLMANAQFQLVFYFLKQNQSNLANTLIKKMYTSSLHDIDKINLYSALSYDISGRALPAKLIISLQEQKLPPLEKAIAQFILAKHYYSKNMIDAFEKTINTIIEQNPQFISAQVFYIAYLIEKKENKRAVDFANKFIYSQPISPYHIYPLNIPYDSLFLYPTLKKLEQQINNSTLSRSGIISSYIGLVHLINYIKHNSSSSLNTSEYYLKKAANIINTHEKTYLFLGILFHYKNNIQTSNQYLNKSYALQENDSNTLFWFAKNNLTRKQNDLAAKTLNQLKHDKTWQWPASNLLALILLEKKQHSQAISTLGGLLQLDPNHFSAWHTLNIIEF